jgi:protein-S-isoprenylcysteine O-methyltransferase Ste14
MPKTGRMTQWGVGPKFAALSLVAALILLTVNIFYFPSLLLPFNQIRFGFGIALFLFGTSIFFVAATQIHRAFNNGKLATNGVYAYMRHPVYAVWILFVAPGLLLVTGALFLIAMIFIMYALFRMLTVEEDSYLEQKFGKDFLDHKKRVNSIVPKLRRKLLPIDQSN